MRRLHNAAVALIFLFGATRVSASRSTTFCTQNYCTDTCGNSAPDLLSESTACETSGCTCSKCCTTNNWTMVEWPSNQNDQGNSINDNQVHVCKEQPQMQVAWTREQAWSNVSADTCASNAECGSALCIEVNLDGANDVKNMCGCAAFLRRFDNSATTTPQEIMTCNCKHVYESPGTCLMVWRDSIMCKFACGNCFTCGEKKFENSCREDKTCSWDATTGLCEKVDGDEETCQLVTDQNECTGKCKWSPNTGNQQTVYGCHSRQFAIMNLGTSANPKCPVGSLRVTDKYRGRDGDYFATCVVVKIDNCLYYEWDGDSCKQCEDNYAPALVTFNRGTGVLKQNALCVTENDSSNQNCEIFEFVTNYTSSHSHHPCARCKEDFEWRENYSAGDSVQHEKMKCEPSYKQFGSLFAIFRNDTKGRFLFALTTLLVIATAGKLWFKYGSSSGKIFDIRDVLYGTDHKHCGHAKPSGGQPVWSERSEGQVDLNVVH